MNVGRNSGNSRKLSGTIGAMFVLRSAIVNPPSRRLRKAKSPPPTGISGTPAILSIPRGCSEDLELREVNADIAQEKARPYTPGHYDGRAFDWAILGYGSGYPSASGLDAPYGAIGIFSIVAAETLIVWLMYYEGRTLIRLWLNGRTTEHHLPIPLWIPEGFFFVGLSLLALQLLVMFLKLLIQLEEENPSLKI